MNEQFEFQFEWDPYKAKRNFRKHRITFELATTIFLDRGMLSRYDKEHTVSEERWITLGMDRTGTLLVVCHTYEDLSSSVARVRIISARKATKSEIQDYEG